MEPKPNPLPRHVGIIMDGNRRFAKALMREPWKGHEQGAKTVRAVLEWCHELGIHELTLYAFSIQNFDRPKREFDYLMRIVRKEAESMLSDPRLEEYDLKVRFLGKLSLFPEDVQEVARKLVARTRNYKTYVLNIAFGYGGQEEILDAVRQVAREVESGHLKAVQISKEVFENHLYTASQPDLVIRTGGARRISNFLLYQSAYTEFKFVDKTWPEFSKEDFVACVEEYMDRHRRFGK